MSKAVEFYRIKINIEILFVNYYFNCIIFIGCYCKCKKITKNFHNKEFIMNKVGFKISYQGDGDEQPSIPKKEQQMLTNASKTSKFYLQYEDPKEDPVKLHLNLSGKKSDAGDTSDEGEVVIHRNINPISKEVKPQASSQPRRISSVVDNSFLPKENTAYRNLYDNHAWAKVINELRNPPRW